MKDNNAIILLTIFIVYFNLLNCSKICIINYSVVPFCHIKPHEPKMNSEFG